jgi:hypothetical protein
MPVTPAILTDWARDFGVVVSVLFLVLLTGISFMWFLVGKQGKTVEDIREILVLHANGTEAAIIRIDAIRTELDSFRNSDKDLLANLKESVAVHARNCEAGNVRVCEAQAVIGSNAKMLERLTSLVSVVQQQNHDAGKDIDAIGRNVDKLVVVLTTKRRQNGDDSDANK